MSGPEFDLIIIGGGPAGLSCALSASRHGLSSVVLEKGSVVDAIRKYPTGMTFFSTADMLAIGGVPFLSSGFRPTRVEAVRYYAHVVRSSGIDLRPWTEAVSLDRSEKMFRVGTANGESLRTRNIVIATGYFDTPRPFEVRGGGLPKVRRYYDEPYGYLGKRVAIVGGKNSAVDAALEMYREGVDVTLIHRGAAFSAGVKYWLLPDIENRVKAGQIRGLFNTSVREVKQDTLVLEGEHAGEIPNDVLFVLIGYTVGPGLCEAVGVRVDRETRVPYHDPTTFETNVPGVFVAGSIAAGNMNNTIFIENGRLHGDVIVNTILQRAERLEK